eukprot:m.57624 g.57624  ORF g.57624 m.57624 type:complete len:58 (+) comp11612_c1_seq1:452-625(+)
MTKEKEGSKGERKGIYPNQISVKCSLQCAIDHRVRLLSRFDFELDDFTLLALASCSS